MFMTILTDSNFIPYKGALLNLVDRHRRDYVFFECSFIFVTGHSAENFLSQ